MTHSPRHVDPAGQEINHELDANTRNAVNRQEAAVYQQIAHDSFVVRDAIAQNFDRTQHRYADRYANGAGTEEEQRLRREEGRYRAVRASVSSEEFNNVRNRLAARPIEARYLDGTTEREANVNVDFNNIYWNGRRLTVDAVRDAITGATAADLAARGITFTGAAPGFTSFNADQATQIARRAITWNIVRTQLQDGGVSAPNVALAMRMARTMPLDELATALNVGGQNDETIRTINARIAAQSALTRLAAIPRQTADLAVILPQIASFNTDLANARTGGVMANPIVVAEFGAAPLVAGDVREARAFIQAQIRPLEASRVAYENMRRESLLVALAYQDRGLPLPPVLAAQGINATNGLQNTDLTAAREPAAMVSAIRAALNIPESGNALQDELAEATRTRNAANERTYTGREVVQNIFQANFQRQEHLAASEAQRAARELYGRNQLTREQTQYMEQSFATQEVLGSEPIEGGDFIWQMGKEAVWGREEAFVHNLATNINRNMVSLTSRFPTGVRRPKARPNWGKGTYADLITAFYALRDSARSKVSGDLSNTSYVRSQLNEIGTILAARHSKEVLRLLDTIQPASRQAEIRAMGEHGQVRAIIDEIMLQPTPSQYSGRVSSALAYARLWTGRARKAVYGWGNRRYRNVRHGEGAWYNPLTYPARGVKAVKATGRAVGGFFSRMYRSTVDFLNQKNRVL